MTGIARTVRAAGTVGAWGAAVVVGIVTFLFVGIVVIGASRMNLGTVALLLFVTVVAGKLSHDAVLRWVGRRGVLVREQERLDAESRQLAVEDEAELHRRHIEALRETAAWEADKPRRDAEWAADAPRREAALKAAEEQKAREAEIRREIETRKRIEREVAEAENARLAAAQQAQYQQQVAMQNQQAAAYNQAVVQQQQAYLKQLESLREWAARASWLPGDVHEQLKLRAKTTPFDKLSIDNLGLLEQSLAALESTFRNANRSGPQYEAAAVEARRLMTAYAGAR